MCFGQFGPYHHARVAALQQVGREHGAEGMEHGETKHEAQGLGQGADLAENRKLNTGGFGHAWRVLPVQIAAATST